VQKVTGGIDFAIDQAPDVIQQLIAFKTFEYLFYCLIGVLLLFVVVKCILYIKKKANKCDEYIDYDPFAPVLIISLVILAVVDFVFLSCIVDLLKITIAPKVWLIEYAATLVK